MIVGFDPNSVNQPGQLDRCPFNKQVILESGGTQFASTWNQSLAATSWAGFLKGIAQSETPNDIDF